MHVIANGNNSKQALRSGEALPVPPPRSRRIVAINSRDKGTSWYFKTREGVLVGSFDSEKEAENGVRDFIDFMVSAPAETRQRYLVHLLNQ